MNKIKKLKKELSEMKSDLEEAMEINKKTHILGKVKAKLNAAMEEEKVEEENGEKIGVIAQRMKTKLAKCKRKNDEGEEKEQKDNEK